MFIQCQTLLILPTPAQLQQLDNKRLHRNNKISGSILLENKLENYETSDYFLLRLGVWIGQLPYRRRQHELSGVIARRATGVLKLLLVSVSYNPKS